MFFADESLTKLPKLQQTTSRRIVNQPTSATQIAVENEPGPSKTTKCNTCNVYIQENKLAAHWRSQHHKRSTCQPSSIDGVYQMETAFKSRIASFRIPTTYHCIDYNEFLTSIENLVHRIIQLHLQRHLAVKANMELFGNYFLKTTGEFSVKSFNTKYEVVTSSTNLQNLYSSFVETLVNKAKDFNENKSGELHFINLRLLKSRINIF